MDKVKDPAFDEQVALQSRLESGLAAFHRINDPQALERIAKEAQHPGIRAAAAGKMENLSQLVHQAQTAPNRTERRKAAAQYVQLAGAFYISNYETHFSFGIKDAWGSFLRRSRTIKRIRRRAEHFFRCMRRTRPAAGAAQSRCIPVRTAIQSMWIATTAPLLPVRILQTPGMNIRIPMWTMTTIATPTPRHNPARPAVRLPFRPQGQTRKEEHESKRISAGALHGLQCKLFLLFRPERGGHDVPGDPLPGD